MEKPVPLYKTAKVRRIFYLLLISLSFCLTAGPVGLLSTLPLAVFVPFAVSFFCFEPTSAAIVAALSAATVSLASGKTLLFTALFSVAAILSTLLLSFASRMIISPASLSRALRITLSFLLLAALCIGYAFTFGNPFSAIHSRQRARDYLSDTYPNVVLITKPETDSHFSPTISI